MQLQLCSIRCFYAFAKAHIRECGRAHTETAVLVILMMVLAMAMVQFGDVNSNYYVLCRCERCAMPVQEHLRSFDNRCTHTHTNTSTYHNKQHTKMLNSNQSIHLNLYGWYSVCVALNCGSFVHTLHLRFASKTGKNSLSSKFVLNIHIICLYV